MHSSKVYRIPDTVLPGSKKCWLAKCLFAERWLSLPSEPSPVSAVIAEKEAVSRVAGGDGAKRSLPLTHEADFGAISRKRGTVEKAKGNPAFGESFVPRSFDHTA